MRWETCLDNSTVRVCMCGIVLMEFALLSKKEWTCTFVLAKNGWKLVQSRVLHKQLSSEKCENMSIPSSSSPSSLRFLICFYLARFWFWLWRRWWGWKDLAVTSISNMPSALDLASEWVLLSYVQGYILHWSLWSEKLTCHEFYTHL